MSEQNASSDNDPHQMVGSPSFENSLHSIAMIATLGSSLNNETLSSNDLSQHNHPFFADAVLDLDEAHDIADTPEATRPRFNATDTVLDKNRYRLQVPTLKLSSESQSETNIVPENELINSLDRGTQQPTLIKRNGGIRIAGDNKLGDSLGEENAKLDNGDAEHSYNGHQENSDMPEREKASFVRITSLDTDIRSIPPPVRPPRWPRDIPWTVAFILFVPISLFYPITLEKHEVHLSPLTRHPLSTATLHALWWTAVATAALCRFLYRSSGGPEGDGVRQAAAFLMTLAAPISVVVYLALAFILYFSCPHARWAVVIPLWYTVRDVFLFRRWKRRTTGSGYASRQAFFQALVCMTLDILARSLRRESFYRVLTAILLVQVGVLLLWRWALLGALGSGSWFVLVVTLVGGKWATGTVARTLSLLASGGVTSWCFQQAASLSEVNDSSTVFNLNSNRRQTQQDEPRSEGSQEALSDNNHANNYDQHENGISNDYKSRVPEAYRTVDASVYRPVLAMDDLLDDDFEDQDDDLEAPNSRTGTIISVQGNRVASKSTVKTILSNGITISFGSIAHCGLLGGLAQFVWSQLRKIEAAQAALSERRGRMTDGFRGMPMGEESKFIIVLWRRLLIACRNFVRNHSDLAITHVASFYKGYNRAARDVAILIDQAGK